MIASMDEDEMTFEQLQAVMLSGEQAMIEPGPTTVHGDGSSSWFHITESTFGAVAVVVGASSGPPFKSSQHSNEPRPQFLSPALT